MKIYSGNYCFCEIGLPTGQYDMHGNELFTGDIVQLWHGNYIGTDLEEWLPSSGLTAIVAEGHEGGWHDKPLEKIGKPFTMGIKDIGCCGDSWKVSIVKSHSDIILGEHFPSFGFNYRD
jgi:hypothetical protein